MGSSLGGLLDQGEAGNIATMKRVLGKYEKIKGRSSTGDRGSKTSDLSDSIIPGVSDKTLYNELERDITAVAKTLDGHVRNAAAATTTTVGTPTSHFDARGIDNSDSNGGSNVCDRAPSPPAFHGQEHDQHQENRPETLSPAPRAPSILVVDDSRISCQIAKRSLSRANCHVEVALDGELGLAMLHSDASSFDLVLLDVVMPGLDGIEMLTRMKQDPCLCHVPVAILSGLEDERLERLCLQKGAAVVLRKPMMADDVVRVVNTYCMPRTVAVAADPERTPVERPVGNTVSSSLSSSSPSASPLCSSVERAGVAKGVGGADRAYGDGVYVDGYGDFSDAGCGGDVGVCGEVVSGAGNPGRRGFGDDFGGCEGASPSCAGVQEGQLQGSALQAIAKTKMTVLVVDDSVISSKLAIRKLRALGYAAISAENGRAALDILRRYPDRVSFVLADIVMPVMDGVELLHVIKNDPTLRQIPVVVVSSLERQQLETLCLASGALAVLRKPLNASEIQGFAAQVGLPLPAAPPATTTTRPVLPSSRHLASPFGAMTTVAAAPAAV